VLTPGDWFDLATAAHQGTSEVRFLRMSYRSGNAGLADRAYSDGPVEFLLEVESNTARTISGVSVSLFDLSGFRLINAGVTRDFSLKRGKNFFKIFVHSLHLKPATYLLALSMAGPPEILLDQILSAAHINVIPAVEPTRVDLNPYHDRVTSQVDVSLV